jgi:hypothetical protein
VVELARLIQCLEQVEAARQLAAVERWLKGLQAGEGRRSR